jgi:phosphopantetheine adenylyltransferase
VLIKASEGLSLVSSTVVREKMKNNEDISDLLPKEALDVIYDILSNK